MPFFSRPNPDDDEPRRRRGDHEDDAMLSFEVTCFEFVPAGEAMGLLRLTGAWHADPDQMVPVPVELEIERDGEAIRLSVLPDPSTPLAVAAAGGEPWRGAFMTQAEVAEDPRADFTLVAGGEVVAGLPRPGDFETDHGYVPTVAEDETPAADAAGALAETEDDGAVRPLDVHGAVAEHVAAREAAEERLDASEATNVLLRHEVETLRAAAESAGATVAELREQVEREQTAREEIAASTEQERQRHHAAESELRRELEDARGELEAASAEIARTRSDLQGAGAERESELHDLRAQLDRAHGELEALRATDDERRAALQRAHAEMESAKDTGGDHAEELERARAELEAARAAAEDRRAELDYIRTEHAAELDKQAAQIEALSAEIASAAIRQAHGGGSNAELEEARRELDLERRRRDTIEEELRVQTSIERQLRDVLAGREAELAATETHVVRRAHAAERRREAAERDPRELEGDFFARLEHAKRLSETSG